MRKPVMYLLCHHTDDWGVFDATLHTSLGGAQSRILADVGYLKRIMQPGDPCYDFVFEDGEDSYWEIFPFDKIHDDSVWYGPTDGDGSKSDDTPEDSFLREVFKAEFGDLP